MNILRRYYLGNRLMDLLGEGKSRSFEFPRGCVRMWRPMAYPFSTQLQDGVVCLECEPEVSRFTVYASRVSFEKRLGPIVTVVLGNTGGQIERTGLYQGHPGAQEVMRMIEGEIMSPPPRPAKQRTLSPEQVSAMLLLFASRSAHSSVRESQ